jgi:hypothetical protein
MPAYSPQDVTAAAAGFPMTGFAEGTFVTVTQQSESAAAFRGADGQTSFAVDRGMPLLQVEFTLQQTSAANAYMAGLLALQSAGAVAFPFSVTNKNSLESAILGQAVIMKAPDSAYSQGIEGRTWTLMGPGLLKSGGSILP